MSGRKTALGAVAQRIASGQPDSPPPPAAAPPPPSPRADRPRRTPVRVATKQVKSTVVLQPQEHRRLTLWCAELELDLAVPEVAGSAVMRALLALAATDEDLRDRVREHLAATGPTRRRYADRTEHDTAAS